MLDKIFGGKDVYVLRGKRTDGKWEEITTYDKRVSWLEVKSESEKDLCQEYVQVILYNKSKRKVEWSKTCPSAHERLSKDLDATKTLMKGMNEIMAQMMTMQSNVMAQMTTVQNTILNLVNNLTQANQRQDLRDMLEQYLQTKELIRLAIREEVGSPSESELDKILGTIERVLTLGKKAEEVKKSVATQSNQSNQSERVTPEAVKRAMEEANRKIDEAYQNINTKILQAYALCEKYEGEKCVQGEGSS